MENKIGAWGLSNGIEELVDMPVVRKYIEPEWLSKLSSREFKTWEKASRELLRRSESEEKIDELIWEEIERREKLYQLYKERQGLEARTKTLLAEKRSFERRYKEDMLYKNHTYDLVSIPSFKDAVMENNGRIYPKDFSLGGELKNYVPDRVDAQVMSLTATTKTNLVDQVNPKFMNPNSISFDDTLKKLHKLKKAIE